MPTTQPLRLGIISLTLMTTLLMLGTTAYGAEEEVHFNWKKGPVTGKLGTEANVVVPAGYRFLDQSETRKFLEDLGNLTSGDEWGVLAPDTGEEISWFIVFQFDNCGYVKDDDKEKLDASAMLKAIKGSDAEANRQRKKQHLPPLTTVGWEQPPNYDEKSHNLQWALRLESGGRQIINHNTRLLGRRGVMEAILVGDPDEMAPARKALRPLLSGFSFTSGHRYAEFRAGDKIAEYGLAALVTGGAVAVALKSGLLAKAWKGLVALAIAGAAVAKRIFRGRETA